MKLDLGCGVNKPAGYVGIDDLTDADIKHDLRQGIPFTDDSIEEIRAKDFLEHMPDTMAIMNECWRVLRPGGLLEVVVPRFPHIDSVKDPMHVRYFAVETFTQYFGGPSRLADEYRMKMWDIVELNHTERRIWVKLRPRSK